MKRIFSILALLILALPLAAQTTSVTATIQDSASVAWGNANFQITWVGQGNPSTTSGQSFPLTVSGTANGSGVMSATVTDVAFIVPTNSTWKVCITSAVSSPNTYCTNVAITGASQDISAQITAALIPPSVTGGPLATAYADSEVAAVFGNQYARLSDNTFRCYTTSWGSCQGSGGGTGTVTSVSVTTANGVSGTVATATTTPAISLTLGDITPNSVSSTAAVSGTNLTASGQFFGGAGTKSAPPFSYTGHTNYGWYYRSGVQEISQNGVATLQVAGATFSIGGSGSTNSLAFAAGDVSSTSPNLYLQNSAANTLNLGSTNGGTNGSINLSTVTNGDGSFGSSETSGPQACETAFGATTAFNGTTTITTGANCLRPNAIIDAVVYRITTTISGNSIASFTIGISGSTSKFCSTQSTLTAGTTGVCVAQLAAGTQFNAALGPIVITENAVATAGAIRIIVYSHTITPPTS